MTPSPAHPVALVTGLSREVGIAAATALTLARSGWTIIASGWPPYDATYSTDNDLGQEPIPMKAIREIAPESLYCRADLEQPESPERIFDTANEQLGPVQALVLAHCHDVATGILETSLESFDRHFRINTRASWLLVQEFGRRFRSSAGRGRIVGITSTHTAHNMPYGASKGAMERIVLAAADEFRELGLTANVIDPGPTDNGWMTKEQKELFKGMTKLGRLGKPQDCANLVEFLCSEKGGWINGQFLDSHGGFM